MQVQIRRREEISHLPTKVINEAKIFIGSHLDGRQPLKGLDPKQEEKYLPQILGISTSHPDFGKQAREYWANMSILVPSGGVVLDITMTEGGEPYNLEDWIRYQWCKRHKYVALSEKEMLNDPRKKFYIYDPMEETNRKHQDIQVQKQADVEFIKAAKDIEKSKRIIRMMDNMINPDSMSENQIENRLFDLKNESPKQFIQIAGDKNLDIKAEIREMISHEILQTVGNQVIYIDQVIGDTVDQAVAWFKDSKNSQIVTQLKAKLNEFKNQR